MMTRKRKGESQTNPRKRRRFIKLDEESSSAEESSIENADSDEDFVVNDEDMEFEDEEERQDILNFNREIKERYANAQKRQKAETSVLKRLMKTEKKRRGEGNDHLVNRAKGIVRKLGFRHVEQLPLDEIVEMESVLEEVGKIKEEWEVSVYTILKSRVSKSQKAKALELFEVLKGYDKHSMSYIELRDKIRSMLEKGGHRSPTEKEESEVQELKSALDETKELSREYRILLQPTSVKNRNILYSKMKQLEMMEGYSDAAAKLDEWVYWGMKVNDKHRVPVSLVSKEDGARTINAYLSNVRAQLDAKLYGMGSVKDEIIMFLNNRIRNPNSKQSVLGLCGPKGTGKTKIARSLAKILKIPFEQISLGGCTDSSFLEGHGYTYEGSKPGQVIQALMRLKCGNGIIFFDEFDKIDQEGHPSYQSKQVSSSLLHIIDQSQNHEFQDKYLDELIIDLSKIWFIVSMNNEEHIDSVLRDRLHIVRVPGYTTKDKVCILRDYLLPSSLKNLDIPQNMIRFSKDALQFMASSTSKEPGCRELKNWVRNIVSKIVLIYQAQLEDGSLGDLKLSFPVPKNISFPINVTPSMVKQLSLQHKN